MSGYRLREMSNSLQSSAIRDIRGIGTNEAEACARKEPCGFWQDAHCRVWNAAPVTFVVYAGKHCLALK